MDWARAKTILIITFFILDIFLGIQIMKTTRERSQLVQMNHISDQQIQPILKDSRIKITARRPSETPFPPLIAHIQKMPDDWKGNSSSGYTRTLASPMYFANKKEQNQRLRSLIPNFEKYQLIYTSPTKLIFLQTEHGHLIFDATCEVSLREGNKIESIHLIPYDIAKNAKAITPISFNSALYQLVTFEKIPRNSTITHAYLGYRARSHPQATDDIYLIPYWCFTINSNQAFYVKAMK